MTNRTTLPAEATRTAGTLTVVATPIGNLGDISARAISTLKAADIIAAEDTRHSGQLLQQLGFSNKLVSYHQHNESSRSATLIGDLLDGKNVAVISDAGTPGVSDPGTTLVNAAHANNIPVSPVPGACAVIAALSASGLNSEKFQFLGFCPQKAAAQKTFFKCILQYSGSSIFYEAPHRITSTVEALAAALPEKRCVIAREISKRFEQIHQCPAGELPSWLNADPNRQRGEFVLIVESAGVTNEDSNAISAAETLEHCLKFLPLKSASKLAAELSGKPKNDLYQLGLALKAQAD